MKTLQWISKYTKIELSLLHALNYLIELKTNSTSIVLREKNDTMWLLRNVDFEGLYLNDLILTGNFFQDDKLLFTG